MTAYVDKFLLGDKDTGLQKILKDKGITTLVTVGTTPHNGVLFTSVLAALRGFNVVVPVDGMAGNNAFEDQIAAYTLANSIVYKVTASIWSSFNDQKGRLRGGLSFRRAQTLCSRNAAPRAALAATDSEAAEHEHARLSGFPASKVNEVHPIIDPMKRLNDGSRDHLRLTQFWRFSPGDYVASDGQYPRRRADAIRQSHRNQEHRQED